MLYLEMLGQGLHELQRQLHLPAAVEGGAGVQAVVAAVAVVLLVVFAEVVQQQLPAALARFGVGGDLGQQLAADLLLGDRLALHVLLQFLYVLVAVVGYAQALLSVASGAPGLLVVALYALGDVVVDHEAHVGLVDAHSEGYGGHYHVDLLHQELVLVLGPGLRVESGMVGQGLDAVDAQQRRQLLHLLAAEAVDYARLAGILADELDYVLLGLDLVPDLIIEVGAVERRPEHFRVGDAQCAQDVALHLGGGGGGQRDYGLAAYLVHYGPDAAVFGAEIVTPFGDAVSLVDGVERNLYLLEQGHVLLLGQRFRSHVKQLGPAGKQILPDLVELLAAQGGIEKVRHALVAVHEAAEQVDLILHERYQRRYHYRGAAHDQRGQLVAQRLAAARGHEHETVSAARQMLDYLLLVALEGVVAEEVL